MLVLSRRLLDVLEPAPCEFIRRVPGLNVPCHLTSVIAGLAWLGLLGISPTEPEVICINGKSGYTSPVHGVKALFKDNI